MHKKALGLAAIVAAVLTTHASAADLLGLTRGTPDLKSATALAFGPEDILLIGDAKAGLSEMDQLLEGAMTADQLRAARQRSAALAAAHAAAVAACRAEIAGQRDQRPLAPLVAMAATLSDSRSAAQMSSRAKATANQ